MACGGVDPAGDELEAALAGYVVLDAPAREAGWSVRVGGWCFPISGDTPVELPADEWVLVGRWEEERHEVQFLHPTPGLLISLHGAALDVEVIEVGEPLEPAEPSSDEDPDGE